jgi:hypothetical protein
MLPGGGVLLEGCFFVRAKKSGFDWETEAFGKFQALKGSIGDTIP